MQNQISDTMDHAERAAKKVVGMRLWDDGETRWMLNAKEQNLEILLVSQFTLYGRLKGAKPDFSHAMKSETSSKFFDDFVELVKKELGDPNRVKTGKFGHYMDVRIQNDGPVTIIYDTGKESE